MVNALNRYALALPFSERTGYSNAMLLVAILAAFFLHMSWDK